MKKEYSKPELDTKAYAQFESVFTGCSRGHKDPGCEFSDQFGSDGQSFNSHQLLQTL